ncbi:stress response protein SCP2 [Deinobacterium chartae]|uniref:Stress response protein SCP2 n=1 Tax=Deinobacterium chartae TaxID=521158 RepID=A0A841I1U3_9DEIO|nr:TerD family protein [Deinobacterium chartae]MBB6097915.1 stress response protein SCP2 [Deinobacterium chartae]
MLEFTRGQKSKLSAFHPGSNLNVVIRTSSGVDTSYDISCFGLDEHGQLSDEQYFVFYNQTASPCGSVRLLGDLRGESETFAVNLSSLPRRIARLMFTLTLDGEGTMAQMRQGRISLMQGQTETARYNFSGRDFHTEKAVIVAELYFKDEWRFGAVGQGFAGGLRALLESVGGEVLDEPESTPPLPERRTCSRCGTFFDRIDPQTGLCRTCTRSDPQYQRRQAERAQLEAQQTEAARRQASQERQVALKFFRRNFLEACSDGVITDAEWRGLVRQAQQDQLSLEDCLAFVRSDAVSFLERTVSMAYADGELSDEEEAGYVRLKALLRLPAALTESTDERMAALGNVTRIRRGDLPSVPASVILESDEVCHLETPATFLKVTARATIPINGSLIVTSRQLHFLSPEGGWRVRYKNIMRVVEHPSGVTLELSTRAGNGTYTVAEPMLAAALLDALVRIDRRQLLSTQTERPSRHIPHDVRIAVFQRDSGKCTHCGAEEYLEFDHIIPHSRGGANTVNNVQLLCRRCNLAKSDRI